MKGFQFLLSALIFASCQSSSETNVAHPIEIKLEQTLDSLYQKHPDAVGFMMHVEAPNKGISWTYAKGYSDRDTKDTLRTNQAGAIASITKTYVAASIFRLIEQDKIKLDQSIKTVIPERTATLLLQKNYDLDSITIAHLLAHRAGIPHSGTKKWHQKDKEEVDYRWSHDELISDAILNLEKGAVGSFNYSDVNYYMLTQIIEEIERTSFWLAMRSLLRLEQHGLHHTWFYTLEPYPNSLPHHFTQYKSSRNWTSTKDESPTFGLYGGAGLYCTVDDLAKFCHLLLKGKIFDKPETLDLMLMKMGSEKEYPNAGWSVVFDPDSDEFASQYRFGIIDIKGEGYSAIGHDGYWGTLMFYLPEVDASFAFFGLNADELIDFEKFYKDLNNTLK
ncbi:MAG: serine hydrolase domain-containing protein [bacterium]